MKNDFTCNRTLITSVVLRLLLVGFGVFALCCLPFEVRLDAADGNAFDIRKSCSKCGRAVSRESLAGQICPHCGAFWADERTTVRTIQGLSKSGAAAFRKATRPTPARETVALTPSSRKHWPRFAHILSGFNQLVLENHTDAGTCVGLRSGPAGCDLHIAAHTKGYFNLPPGLYQVYVFRYNRPTELFDGGTISIAESISGRSAQTVCLWLDDD